MNSNTPAWTASLALTAPKLTASQLADDIGLRYDGEIPADAQAAIAAAQQAERDAKRTAGMTDAEKLRFQAAKEWRLLKGEFRTLCRMVRHYSVKRTDDCFRQMQRNARAAALSRIEAWADVRRQERRAAERRAAE